MVSALKSCNLLQTPEISLNLDLNGKGDSCTKKLIKRAQNKPVQTGRKRHCSFHILCTFVLVILHLQCGNVSAHIASFISSEGGKPNLTPRPIRGPTVPTMPYPPSSSEILRLPGFTFLRGGSGNERKFYLRNMNDGSFASVNSGFATSGRNGVAEDDNDKPTFVPYISPRALSSVNEYLKHIRENLEALHSGEYDTDDDTDTDTEAQRDFDYGENEEFTFGEIPAFSHRPSSTHDRQHSRRHVNPNPSDSGSNSDPSWVPHSAPLLDPSSHSPNRRQFVEPETFVIRRTTPNHYSPSWSYTKLGLGKRKRGGGSGSGMRIRPWQQ